MHSHLSPSPSASVNENPRITFRHAEPADAAELNDFARDAFIRSFGHLYSEAELLPFLAQRYNEAVLREKLRARSCYIYIAHDGERVAGFVKADVCELPVAAEEEGAYEIHHLYVSDRWHGHGIGRHLLSQAIDWCEAQGARSIYVGVWEENEGAQRLYARAGFAKHSEYLFRVGIHADREWIMRREVV